MRALPIAVRLFWTLAVAGPAAAQEPAGKILEEATPAIESWLNLVRGGGGETALLRASARFQYRVWQNPWRTWVDKSAPSLRELRPRKAIETSIGQDQPPLEPLQWVRVTYSSEWPSGGKVYEQLLAIREDDGVWRIADYAAWPDPEAIMHNAQLETVPYRSYYYPGFFVHGWRGRFVDGHGQEPPPPVDRGSTRANPRTFPRRPPA